MPRLVLNAIDEDVRAAGRAEIPRQTVGSGVGSQVPFRGFDGMLCRQHNIAYPTGARQASAARAKTQRAIEREG